MGLFRGRVDTNDSLSKFAEFQRMEDLQRLRKSAEIVANREKVIEDPRTTGGNRAGLLDVSQRLPLPPPPKPVPPVAAAPDDAPVVKVPFATNMTPDQQMVEDKYRAGNARIAHGLRTTTAQAKRGIAAQLDSAALPTEPTKDTPGGVIIPLLPEDLETTVPSTGVLGADGEVPVPTPLSESVDTRLSIDAAELAWPIIIQMESSGDPDALNPLLGSTSSGLSGTTDPTAWNPGFGVRPWDGTVADKVRVGREYFGEMVDRSGNLFAGALAYHWGPGAYDTWVDGGANGQELLEAKGSDGKKIGIYLVNLNAHLRDSKQFELANTEQEAFAAKRFNKVGAFGPTDAAEVTPESVEAAEPEPTAAAEVTPEIIEAAKPELTAALETVIEDMSLDRDVTKGVQFIIQQPNPPAPTGISAAQMKQGGTALRLANKETMEAMAVFTELKSMASAYKMAGMNIEAIAALGAANRAASAAYYWTNEEAIVSFKAMGDPVPMQNLMSQEMGQQIMLVPRSDGLWNVTADGQTIQAGISTNEIASDAKKSNSSLFAQQVAQAVAAELSAWATDQRGLEKDIIVEHFKTMNTLRVDAGKAALKLEFDGNGTPYGITEDGRRFKLETVEGKDINGNPRTSIVAVPIQGLGAIPGAADVRTAFSNALSPPPAGG